MTDTYNSKFDIVSKEKLANLCGVKDFTNLKDIAGTTRVYDDAQIFEQISAAEKRVFGTIHKKYTRTQLDSDDDMNMISILDAIEQLARIKMSNILKRDNVIGGEAEDEMTYFMEYILPLQLEDDVANNGITSVTNMSDYYGN